MRVVPRGNQRQPVAVVAGGRQAGGGGGSVRGMRGEAAVRGARRCAVRRQKRMAVNGGMKNDDKKLMTKARQKREKRALKKRL